ncbi:MAG TPA: hypothetical protein VI011_07560 [Asanoa sp.]
MRRRPVNALSLPEGAAEAVHAYLDRLDAALPASARDRHEVVAEVGDGLACAVEAGIAADVAPAAAAAAAIAELGAADDLAAGYAAELAPRAAHRTGLALILSGPVVGSAWLAAGPAADLPGRFTALLTAVPLYPLLLAVAVPAAVIGVVGARLPMAAAWSSRAAVLAAAACIVADVMLLAAALDAPADHDRVWLAVAASVSGTRLVSAGVAMRRVARLELAAG